MMRAPSFILKPLVASLLVANMSPSERLFQEGAGLVDRDGQVLELTNPAVSLAGAREATGYIIVDARIARLFTKYPNYISTAPGIAYAYFPDYAQCRPDVVRSAATIDALAALISVPPIHLRTAAKDLHEGPFSALGPVDAMLTVTEGSVAVDEQCRVLRENGEPIEGLFAVGGVGQGGMLLKGHGLHIAWTLTSGRVAGEIVARRMPAAASGAELARSRPFCDAPRTQVHGATEFPNPIQVL